MNVSEEAVNNGDECVSGVDELELEWYHEFAWWTEGVATLVVGKNGAEKRANAYLFVWESRICSQGGKFMSVGDPTKGQKKGEKSGK